MDMTQMLNEATGPGEPQSPLTVPFSVIPAIPAEYLWPGVLPYRTPVMLAAPGGTGKGLAIAAIIARVTTGEPFPGEPEDATREPQQVIIVAPEDDPNEDLAFRLEAAGADRSLVNDMTLMPDGSPFLLPDCTEQLRDAIEEVNARGGPPVGLVALDPLMAMLSASIASPKAARKLISGLQGVARDTGVAMIIAHHTVKSGRVAGSSDITNAMRMVWRISVDPQDPKGRLIRPEKSNRGMEAQLRYVITGEGDECRAVFTSAQDDVPGSRAARLRIGYEDEIARRREIRKRVFAEYQAEQELRRREADPAWHAPLLAHAAWLARIREKEEEAA